MYQETDGVAAAGDGPARSLVEGERLKVVRLGSGAREVPQGVLGLDAISHAAVGSGGMMRRDEQRLRGARAVDERGVARFSSGSMPDRRVPDPGPAKQTGIRQGPASAWFRFLVPDRGAR
ncbi:hypothetical protein GBA63_06480 [Rubrobacter tropicus]|uniref:Uncharacterized protein n=1 Tax=Rubrobacter tropicus TaxID=2653851 RepID=A0A6G8Q779_9ACTN|nr:hypothetical protein [Rubrobacter tropicus]QIN82335.1 hypothetical protein GBA63_06480 [Rubrobacter tropicus]